MCSTVGQVGRVFRPEWGLSRRAMRVVYGGLFVDCAKYGACILYMKALDCITCAPPLDLEEIRANVPFLAKMGLPLWWRTGEN